MNAVNAEKLERVKETVEDLDDVDFSNTAAVEIKLDSVASALLDLQGKPKSKEEAKSLSDVLSALVENGTAIDPVAITIADEVVHCKRTKDYEGYSDKYVASRLESLLSDLKNELESAVNNFEPKAQH